MWKSSRLRAIVLLWRRAISDSSRFNRSIGSPNRRRLSLVARNSSQEDLPTAGRIRAPDETSGPLTAAASVRSADRSTTDTMTAKPVERIFS